MADATVIEPEGLRVIEALGNRLTFRVPGERTGGAFAVVEFEVAAGFVAPPVLHQHAREDWWGQITEGRLALQLGDKRMEAGAGA
jgi:hypothetical protein